MKKSIIIFVIIFLFIPISSVKAQTRYDTIRYSNITINNEKLFTKFNNIQKFIDDTKTNARIFICKEANIPFICTKPEDILYSIYSQELIFSYIDEKPNDIYISYVKPNKDLILKIETKNTSIIMTKKNALSLLKRFYKNSFKSFQNDKKEFKLIVKKGNQYALCCLIFDDCRFVEMYLTEISQSKNSI